MTNCPGARRSLHGSDQNSAAVCKSSKRNFLFVSPSAYFLSLSLNLWFYLKAKRKSWFKAGASASQWVFATSHNSFLAHGRCEAEKTCSLIVSSLSNQPTIFPTAPFTLVLAGKGLRANATQRRRAAAAATTNGRRRSSKTQTPNGAHAIRSFHPRRTAAASAASHRLLLFPALHRKSCIYFICCHAVMALGFGQETAADRIYSLNICSRTSLEHSSGR